MKYHNKLLTRVFPQSRVGMSREQFFWVDGLARRILSDLQKRGIKKSVYRVESGIGASGFPHIGSVGDSLRAYAIKLGLENLGVRSELIAYSDDRDGLRKVPHGIPKDFRRYLGIPVTDIPDPFGCHSSYGEHMSSMLVDALERLEIEFTFISGTEAYRSGLLSEEISILLKNHREVYKIVREEVGTNKPEGWVFYWPVCENCGRIYTTRVTEVLPEEGKVLYTCDQEFMGVKGCNCSGEQSYERGPGKLSWKGEFAARWRALDIVFEPHGKDIADSFRVNARICKEVLGKDPPFTITYEMFLDSSGTKISKSKGNVITPQDWLRYAPPETIRMLMLKRYSGTRNISLEMIPLYISELERNLSLYWNPTRIKNPRDRENLRRLVEYTYLLREVPRPHPFSFNTMISLMETLPINELDEGSLRGMAADLISKYYDLDKNDLLGDEVFKRYFEYALNFIKDISGLIEAHPLELDNKALEAVKQFLSRLEDSLSAEEIQELAFNVTRSFNIPAPRFFSAVYFLLSGNIRGPKLGPLIKRIGVSTAKEIILSNMNKLERCSHD